MTGHYATARLQERRNGKRWGGDEHLTTASFFALRRDRNSCAIKYVWGKRKGSRAKLCKQQVGLLSHGRSKLQEASQETNAPLYLCESLTWLLRSPRHAKITRPRARKMNFAGGSRWNSSLKQGRLMRKHMGKKLLPEKYVARMSKGMICDFVHRELFEWQWFSRKISVVRRQERARIFINWHSPEPWYIVT